MEFKSATEGSIVNMASIDDLVKLTDELGKPIMHQTLPHAIEGEVYFMLDNLMRYQYYFLENERKKWKRISAEHNSK